MSSDRDQSSATNAEPKVELHACACSCGGGSWIILGTASSAPCGKDAGRVPAGAVLTLSEWRDAGKPNTMEAYAERQDRVAPGERRREFKRYAVSLPVTLRRIPTWRDTVTQGEETSTEVIAQGGSLVRSRMAVEEGEILMFEMGRYKTRAQVLYMTQGADPGGPSYLRLGVRFLDELMPQGLIPAGAVLLE